MHEFSGRCTSRGVQNRLRRRRTYSADMHRCSRCGRRRGIHKQHGRMRSGSGHLNGFSRYRRGRGIHNRRRQRGRGSGKRRIGGGSNSHGAGVPTRITAVEAGVARVNACVAVVEVEMTRG